MKIIRTLEEAKAYGIQPKEMTVGWLVDLLSSNKITERNEMIYYTEQQVRDAIDFALGTYAMTLALTKSGISVSDIKELILHGLLDQPPLTLNVTVNVNQTTPDVDHLVRELANKLKGSKISL